MYKSQLFILFSFLLSVLFSPGVVNSATAQENSWKAPPEAVEKINPVTADNESIQNGKSLFIRYCSTCHGNEGTGDGPTAIRLITEPPDLTANKGRQTDGELAWKIAAGKNPMPKWGDKLTEKEIWDIVNFIRKIQADAE